MQSAKIHIGCCGWSYLNEKEFFTKELLDFQPGLYGAGRSSNDSKLQVYARLFNTVEINSTFYRLPRLSTAEKWRKEADAVNPDFEFTVKAYQGITHLHRFQSKTSPLNGKKESLVFYEAVKEICLALHAKLILFQTPASFKPSKENIDAMINFFEKINRKNITAVWEPRGEWYDDIALIKRVCLNCNLVHCVDPFRNDPLVFGEDKIAYLRLHGFGKPSMYRYNFSKEELLKLQRKIRLLSNELNDIYIFFNNDMCYHNGREFRSLIL